MATKTPVFELKCRLQTYPWGKTGLDGLAGQLAHASGSHYFEYDADTRYAELWMGTHENGAATLQDGTPLQQYVDRDPDYYLGKSVLSKFDGDTTVPFLFKILTARKALQLQIHPDKHAAAKLHEQDPQEFKDTNHKPEIALAVTPCEIFAGFRPADQINEFLDKLPELKEVFGSARVSASDDKEQQTEVVRGMLRRCFDTRDATSTIKKLLASDALLEFTQERGLLQRCAQMYPGDSGALVVVFLMNFFLLQPGESAYVKEDGIHAWFTGDMIECMAVSDNVLNTGFIPESDRQKQAFLELVRYDNKPHADHAVSIRRYEKSHEGKTLVYDPPIEEFSILRTELEAGESETIDGVDGPGILIVVAGKAKLSYEKDGQKDTVQLSKGHVFYVAPGTKLAYEAMEELQVFEAISGEMMNRDGDIGQ